MEYRYVPLVGFCGPGGNRSGITHVPSRMSFHDPSSPLRRARRNMAPLFDSPRTVRDQIFLAVNRFRKWKCPCGAGTVPSGHIYKNRQRAVFVYVEPNK